MAAPAPRRRRAIGQRRRVEDEGDEDGVGGAVDMDDDSLSDGSLATDDHDHTQDSDTSNIDEASPTSAPPVKRRSNGATADQEGRPSVDEPLARSDKSKPLTDTDMMLHGLSIKDQPLPAQDMHFDEVAAPSPSRSPSAPIVVSSASAGIPPSSSFGQRRRQEHEDYKKRRDEDPAFVPNRGAFFMHDHRHAGPAANGFRPFGRGRGRGGRGAIGGPFAPVNQQMYRPNDPTTSFPWAHDMHETVAEAIPRRPRQMAPDEGPPNGNGIIPTRDPNPEPINRTLSAEKHIGNAQVRVWLPQVKLSVVLPGLAVKQYTKLPDHRPPLRRDKPVRISLPDHPPRYVFPAVDRSFIFIPRAMRPNQQRMRGKSRLGSVGGFSRRPSTLGGSYYGSVYSPTVAASRRSSFVYDRDHLFSPTGSVMSRPPVPIDGARPIVRLPPGGPRADALVPAIAADPASQPEHSAPAQEALISDIPPPQTHPLPQKPAVAETRQAMIPMQHPRPQKSISVADIESPALSQGPPAAFQQAFHQQVPVGVVNGLQREAHSRQHSYPSQHSTGTPLSQIPERAIHAAPFQPHIFGPQAFYQHHAYQAQPSQQGYFYGSGYSAQGMPAPAGAPHFIPAAQHGMHPGPDQLNQMQPPTGHRDGPVGHPGNPNLVAQEANGMVYYYDASQMASVGNYPSYPGPQAFPSGVMGMNGEAAPSPDGYYYAPPGPGMVYYLQ